MNHHKSGAYAKQMNTMLDRFGRGETHKPSSWQRNMAVSLSRMLDSTSALRNVSSSRDPYATDAMHEKRILEASGRVTKHLDATVDQINAIARDALNSVEERISAKAPLAPSKFDGEIRAIFRDMKPAARHKAIEAAIEQMDSETLSALLTAPAVVTGISKDETSRYINEYRQKVAPDEFAEQIEVFRRIDEALLLVEVARKDADESANPLRVAAADKEQQRASEALDNLTKAVGGA